DGGLQDDTALLTRLVALLRELRPHVVYLPHAGDEPRDHRATHALVSEAVRRAAGPWFAECGDQPWRVQTVLGYEVWTPLPRAGFVLDISAVMADKLEALRMHVSQVSGVAYHQAVAGLNRYRGGMTGRGEYCECFEVVLASRLW
ncbi:MAG: hypothetical protein NUV35_09485, partial [Syntrophomonadaceae bacterium]|nr:hypothetical protein [Syntrophomonadaceae bacterium]